MVINYFILLFLGIITSYTDFTYHKIRNNHLAVAFTLSLILMLIFEPLRENIISLSIAIALGLLLWYMQLWSAGDAKLFIVTASLLPAATFTSLYLLAFSVVPLFIVLEIPVLYHASRKEYLNALIQSFQWRIVTNSFLYFVIAYSILKSSFSMPVIVFILIGEYVINFLQTYYVTMILMLTSGTIFFFYPPTPYEFFAIIGVTLLYVLFRYGCMAIAEASLRQKIPTSNLQEGMLIHNKGDVDYPHEGIDKKEILALQSKFSFIEIHRYVPFAPFVFLGVILFYLNSILKFI